MNEAQSFDPRTLGGVGTAPGQLATAAASLAAGNLANRPPAQSRSAGLSSRLHELVDNFEKLVGAAHQQLDRVVGSQAETTGTGPTPPSGGAHLDRFEDGLRRLERLLKSDAVALYHRLTEL